MKLTLLTISLFASLLTSSAAELEAPKLVSSKPTNEQWTHVLLTWTHPTAYKFEVRFMTPTANFIAFERPPLYRVEQAIEKHEFTKRCALRGPQNLYQVRAIDAGMTSDWSNIILVVPIAKTNSVSP